MESGHQICMATPSVGEAGETGGWRSDRPVVVTPEECLAVKAGRIACQLCWVYCPDACITKGIGPVIDLVYCKGCGICSEVCPSNVIEMRPEHEPAPAACGL